MIEIIKNIDSKICQLLPQEAMHGLVELVKKDKQIFPAKYQSGSYYKVQEGIYHRVIGKFKQKINPDSSCLEEITRTYPLRLVCIINKVDELKVSGQLSNLVDSLSLKSVANQIGALMAYVDIDNINVLRDEIFKSEFSGENFIPYEKSLISIDYTVTIVAKKNCIDSCTVLSNKD